MSETLLVKFYNLQVSRDPAQVDREIQALLDSGPEVLGLCEATGYDLPDRGGYAKIRDRSNKSRANVAAYVNKALLGKVTWHDLHETWTRTQHPGTHEPRSWIEARVGGVQLLIGHQPPKGTDNTKAAQQEGIDLLVARMAPWKQDDWSDRSEQDKADAKACPRISVADMNRGPNEDGPGPKALRNQIDGWTAGQQIDSATCRGGDCWLKSVDYVSDPQGVKLKSDHGDALVLKVSMPSRWLDG